MSLAGVDLNLLVALDALLAERSVTRAAEKINLTPGAVSLQLQNEFYEKSTHPLDTPQ